MIFELRLLETKSEITRLIFNQIKDYLEPRIDRAANNSVEDIRVLISEALKQEPEYQSLINGQLKAELGLPNTNVVDSVIDLLSRSTQLETKPLAIKTTGLTGGFSLYMIKSDDLGGVINTVSASVNIDGGSIPWLEWLTLKGNQILVRDFKVQFGPNKNSRSGLAIMKPSTGSNWRIPPEFVGTQNNNWITRAISTIDNKVYDLMIKNLEAQI
jgi:hypothetical protein